MTRHARDVQITFVIALLLGAAIFSSCSQSPTESASAGGGVVGAVYDTSGVPLDSVRIYSMYSYGYPLPVILRKGRLSTISKVDTFGFNFFQNVPNPVRDSVYLRFSIPVRCDVEIRINSRSSGSQVYSYSSLLSPGLYQLYAGPLVDSLDLENGAYTVSFIASGNGREYLAAKEMFVVSTLGKPNAITTRGGSYSFKYADAFVGDSIVVSPTEFTSQYTVIIGPVAYLLFERRGYNPLLITAQITPGVDIRRDVILTKMSTP